MENGLFIELAHKLKFMRQFYPTPEFFHESIQALYRDATFMRRLYDEKGGNLSC